MSFLKNRIASLCVIVFVYALAVMVSIFIYPALNMSFWKALLVTDVIATIIVFIFSNIFRNASVYDPYWSVQPIVIILCFAVKNGINTLGILLVIAVCFWGVRLTANWVYTFENLTWQDWRYTMLKEKTKFFYPFINFVGIHMVPTLVVYLCILPAVYAINTQTELNPLSIIFVLLSITASTIQGIADLQMHTFKKNGGKGFIRVGLWKHSRHPNYLGEILMWWGIGLASLISMPGNYFLLAGAIANTCLFLCVSIPLAEKHQARKPGFEDYKKQTRVLI